MFFQIPRRERCKMWQVHGRGRGGFSTLQHCGFDPNFVPLLAIFRFKTLLYLKTAHGKGCKVQKPPVSAEILLCFTAPGCICKKDKTFTSHPPHRAIVHISSLSFIALSLMAYGPICDCLAVAGVKCPCWPVKGTALPRGGEHHAVLCRGRMGQGGECSNMDRRWENLSYQGAR